MLFWNRKQGTATKVEEIKKAEIIIPTADIVRSANLEYVDLLDRELNEDEEHLQRYLYTLERNKVDDTSTIDVGFITKARKKGFKLLVKPNVVQQFTYAAIVYSTNDETVHKNNTDVVYIGDIPDFALDKIIDAQNAGLYPITIHSNQELPVKYEKYVYRDPVLIGWNSNPKIVRHNYEWICTGHYVTVGCVIAMWGNEGQPL